MNQSGVDAAGANLFCDYSGRKWVASIPGLFGVLALVAGVMALVSDATPQKPVFLGPAFLLFGVAALAAAGCAWAQASNERIEIQNGHITWIDWRGQTKVSCRIDDVITGTFKVSMSALGGGQSSNSVMIQNTQSRMIYRVGTRAGDVRWNCNISNFDQLTAVMQSYAGQAGEPYDRGGGSAKF